MSAMTRFEYKGYQCKYGLNYFQTWVGYCTLPRDHRDAPLNYDDVDINVHGGLTYGRAGTFGFDCAHSNDYVPGLASMNFPGATVWNEGMVRSEIEFMVDQFIERASLPPPSRNKREGRFTGRKVSGKFERVKS